MKDKSLTRIKEQLFEAFRDDHAVMGRGFYDLAERLRGNDEAGARQIAERINSVAGAHIAFEENDFYPALRPFLSDSEVQEMYQDHARSRNLLQAVMDLSDGDLTDDAKKSNLLKKVEEAEAHIAECGELFGALGGLTADEQTALLKQLRHWREQAPQWLDLPVMS